VIDEEVRAAAGTKTTTCAAGFTPDGLEGPGGDVYELRPAFGLEDECLHERGAGYALPLADSHARISSGFLTREAPPMMKQSVSLITLGVTDYARARSFYTALGWSTALEVQETAFFQANGVVLVLWSREKLAADSGVADDGSQWSGITLAHNVESREAVDELIELARANGATVSREPFETFYGGYAGVFRDLDGHAWEIAHNPGFGLAPDGSVVLPPS
jgi:uncharacterized protein